MNKIQGTVGVKLEPFPLRLSTLHSGSSPALPFTSSAQGHSIFGKYLNAHLKFTVYGRKQANKHVDIHTHFRNVVPLMWGLLRLTPIMLLYKL